MLAANTIHCWQFSVCIMNVMYCILLESGVMVHHVCGSHTFFVSSIVMPDDEKTRTVIKYDV